MLITANDILSVLNANSELDNSKSISNARNALSVVIDVFGADSERTDLSRVLGEDLTSTIVKVKKSLKDSNYGQRHINNVCSIIRNSLREACEILALSSRGQFHELLSSMKGVAKKDKGLSPKQFVDALHARLESKGYKYSYIRDHVHSNFSSVPVTEKFKGFVRAIDEVLGSNSKFELAFLIYERAVKKNTRKGEPHTVGYHVPAENLTEREVKQKLSRKCSTLVRYNNAPNCYIRNFFAETRLHSIGEKMELFIGEVNQYKTKECVGLNETVENKMSTWTLKALPDSSLSSVTNKFGKKFYYCKSAKAFWENIGRFYGYLTLPDSPNPAYFNSSPKISLSEDELAEALEIYTGEGFTQSELSCYMLIDINHLESFVEYCETHELLTILNHFFSSMIGLLGKKGGYFMTSTQAKKEAIKYLTEKHSVTNEDEYEEYINKLIKIINRMAKNAKKQNTNTSDSLSKINFILKREDPISFLLETKNNAESIDHSMFSLRQKLIHLRGLLLLCILIYNPLRARTICSITVPHVSRGTLIKRDEGLEFYFTKDHFKNLRDSDKGSYKANFPKSLMPLLDEYLEVRSEYIGDADIDSLFISTVTQNDDKVGPFDTTKLSDSFKSFINKHRPREDYYRPFGCHAVRHIVATTYLRRNPDHYVTVAEILHDTIDTVVSTYGFMSPDHGLNKHHDMIGTIENELKEVS